MQTYIDEVEETLSLSNFYKEDDTRSSQRSLSSSSSSSLSDQDFLGFFSDEWNGNTSYGILPKDIVFCGKVISSREPMARDRNAVTKTQTRPLFRSNSDSFRFMRLKTSLRPSTTRGSKSFPNKSASFLYKSKLMVFMFGSGSSKFLNKVEMSDIKCRQLRRQSSIMTVSAMVESGKEENGGRKSGSKGWWRVVDVLGCGGGYEKGTLGVI